MKLLRYLLALLLFFSICEYSRAAQRDDVIFHEDFPNSAALKKWQGVPPQTQIVAGENGGALQVERNNAPRLRVLANFNHGVVALFVVVKKR